MHVTSCTLYESKETSARDMIYICAGAHTRSSSLAATPVTKYWSHQLHGVYTFICVDAQTWSISCAATLVTKYVCLELHVYVHYAPTHTRSWFDAATLVTNYVRPHACVYITVTHTHQNWSLCREAGISIHIYINGIYLYIVGTDVYLGGIYMYKYIYIYIDIYGEYIHKCMCIYIAGIYINICVYI